MKRLHMKSQHSNSLALNSQAILVHNENLCIQRMCTKMGAISMAKGCMEMLIDVLPTIIAVLVAVM